MTRPDDSAMTEPTPEEVLAQLAAEIEMAHATGDSVTLISKLPPLLNVLMRHNGPTPHGWMLIGVPFGDGAPENIRFATNVGREGVMQLLQYTQHMAEKQLDAPAQNGEDDAPRH